MTSEPWKKPTWTVDQVRRLGRRIRSLARADGLTTRVSSVLMFLLVLEIGFFMYFFFSSLWGMQMPPPPEWFTGVLLLTFMITITISAVAGSIHDKLIHLLEVYRKVGIVVQIKCARCGRISERTWNKGDYVFKPEGTCACGGETHISKMYMMPLPIKVPSFYKSS